MTTIADRALAVKDEIQRRGWLRGELYDVVDGTGEPEWDTPEWMQWFESKKKDCPVCAVGAVGAVFFGDPELGYDSSPERDEFIAAWTDVIYDGRTSPHSPDDHANIYEFNDHQSTADPILDSLDRLAAKHSAVAA